MREGVDAFRIICKDTDLRTVIPCNVEGVFAYVDANVIHDLGHREGVKDKERKRKKKRERMGRLSSQSDTPDAGSYVIRGISPQLHNPHPMGISWDWRLCDGAGTPTRCIDNSHSPQV